MFLLVPLSEFARSANEFISWFQRIVNGTGETWLVVIGLWLISIGLIWDIRDHNKK